MFYAQTIVDTLDEMDLEEFTVTDSTKDNEHYYEKDCDLHKYDNSMRHKVMGCFRFRKR